MKYYAFIKSGQVVQRGGYSNPEDIPGGYDEVIEITKDLAKSEYPIEYKGKKIQIDVSAKTKIDEKENRLSQIDMNVEAGNAVSNQDMIFWMRHRGGK